VSCTSARRCVARCSAEVEDGQLFCGLPWYPSCVGRYERVNKEKEATVVR